MIPATPLRLQIETNQLRLDDVELFEPGGFSVRRFKAFMARYSTWSADDVGQLTIDELKQVADQIAVQLRELAVPKVTADG